MGLFGTAIILAGGKSSRMGFDKARIEICGKPIVALIIDQLREIFEDVIVVTNNPKGFSGLDARITGDILKGAGPLGGIHAGLTLAKSEYSFLTACDMPVISTGYAKYMMDIASKDMPHAVITEKGDWVEPFHALYKKSLIDDIENNIRMGRFKIFDVLRDKKMVRISEDKARGYSLNLSIFTNLNDSRDLEDFMKQMKARGMENVLL